MSVKTCLKTQDSCEKEEYSEKRHTGVVISNEKNEANGSKGVVDTSIEFVLKAIEKCKRLILPLQYNCIKKGD